MLLNFFHGFCHFSWYLKYRWVIYEQIGSLAFTKGHSPYQGKVVPLPWNYLIPESAAPITEVPWISDLNQKASQGTWLANPFTCIPTDLSRNLCSTSSPSPLDLRSPPKGIWRYMTGHPLHLHPNVSANSIPSYGIFQSHGEGSV